MDMSTLKNVKFGIANAIGIMANRPTTTAKKVASCPDMNVEIRANHHVQATSPVDEIISSAKQALYEEMLKKRPEKERMILNKITPGQRSTAVEAAQRLFLTERVRASMIQGLKEEERAGVVEALRKDLEGEVRAQLKVELKKRSSSSWPRTRILSSRT